MVQNKKTSTKKKVVKNVCAEFLHESEEQYRQLVELSQDAIVLIDNKGIFRMANPAACSLFGYPSEKEMVGTPVLNTYPPEHRADYAKRLKQIKLGESPRFERKALRKNGELIDIEVATTPIDHEKYQAIIRDISDRKNSELIIKRQNHILSILGDSNEALLRISDEQKLLKEICRIAVEDNGYRLAWVGYANDDKAKTVQPMAYHGFEKGYLENLKIEWANTPHGQGPTGTAIRTGKPVVCQNILTNPKFTPWRKDALSRGYQSSIALPIIIDKKTVGALNIYSPEKDSFKKDEINLLVKLTDNLAFGIEVIRARNEIQKIGDMYSTLVEKSNDGILILQGGLLRYVNSEASKMTGYPREAVLGKPFLDYVAPEYKKTVLDNYSKRIRGIKAPNRYEIEILSKDGHKTPVEVSASLVKYEGSPAVMAIVRDVTERKIAEENFRRIFDESPIGLATLGPDLKFTKVNKTFCNFIGYNEEELLQLGIRDITHPDHIASDLGKIKTLVSGGAISYKTEKKYVRKDGDIVWGLSTVRVVKENGLPVYFLKTVENITYRKIAEEELLRKIEEINNFFDITPDLLCIVDSSGKFLRLNKSWETMLGYPINDLVGKNFIDFIHPDDKETTRKLLNIATQEPIVDFSNRCLAKDGSYRTLEWRSRPVGGIVYATARDITERK